MRKDDLISLETGVEIASELPSEQSVEGRTKIISCLIYAGTNLSVYSRVEEEIQKKIAQLGWTSLKEGDFLRVKWSLTEDELISIRQEVIPLKIEDREEPLVVYFESKATVLQDQVHQLIHNELVKTRHLKLV